MIAVPKLRFWTVRPPLKADYMSNQFDVSVVYFKTEWMIGEYQENILIQIIPEQFQPVQTLKSQF